MTIEFVAIGLKVKAGKLLVLLFALSFFESTASDRVELLIKLHESSVRSVSFSQCGRFLATASDDGTARIISLIDGLDIVIHHDKAVSQAEFTPCGEYVLTRSRDKTAKLVKSIGGKLITQISHEAHISSIKLSPCSRYAVTLSRDGTARIITIPDGRVKFAVEHGGGSGNIAFSPCSRFVVIDSWSFSSDLFFCRQGSVKAYSLSSAEQIFCYQYSDNTGGPYVSPCGQHLAICCHQRANCVMKLMHILGEKESKNYSPNGDINEVVFSPCGLFLAGISNVPGANAVQVEIVVLKDLKRLTTVFVKGEFYGFSFSPFGSFFGVISSSGIKISSVSGIEQILLPECQQFSSFWPREIVFSQCERYVAIPDARHSHFIHSLSSGALVVSVPSYRSFPQGVAFSPCGRFVAHLTKENGVKILGLISDTLEEALSAHCRVLQGSAVLGESFLLVENRSLTYLRLHLESAKTHIALTRDQALELAQKHVEPELPGYSRLKSMIEFVVFPTNFKDPTGQIDD